MINSCGIYSVVCKGLLNAPFVALNDDQAMKICAQAFKGSDISADDFELDRIGTLHFVDGIIDTDRICVVRFNDLEFDELLAAADFIEEDVNE